MIPVILVRHVARAVVIGIVLVSVLLVGLYTIIELIREARGLAGGYGALQMMAYLAQTAPRRLYDVFPFAALIGTLLGLGGLAASNELVAMRAAGFDRRQIMLSVMAAVGGCLLLLFVFGEWLIPDLETRATADREQARSGQVRLGRHGSLWLRDGQLVLRVGYSAWVAGNEPEFGNLMIYRLDSDMRPLQVMTAGRAVHTGTSWQFFQYDQRNIDESLAGVEAKDPLEIESTLNPDLFAASVTRPRLLSIRDLRGMIQILTSNELDASAYEQAMWGRLFFPINVLVMVMVGLPFVFRGGRQGNRGLNLFAGVALGLIFFVFSRLTQGIAMLWAAPFWLTALLPALIIGSLGILMLRRI